MLEQAVRTLSEDGLEGLRLRKLASDVDTSTTAVYALFKGKPGLVHALLDEGFARFGRTLAGVRHTGDPAADLASLGRAYRANALAEPDFYQVMFGSVGGAARPSPESARRALATFEPLVDAVRRAMDAGLPRRTDPVVVATAFWSCVHGLVSLELRSLLPPGAGPPEELYDRALSAMAQGWAV